MVCVCAGRTAACLGVCVCVCARAWMRAPVWVCAVDATQTWAASLRLAGMVDSSSRNNRELRNARTESCKHSCLADLVLSGLSTPQFRLILAKVGWRLEFRLLNQLLLEIYYRSVTHAIHKISTGRSYSRIASSCVAVISAPQSVR